jgi:hypothetical protein
VKNPALLGMLIEAASKLPGGLRVVVLMLGALFDSDVLQFARLENLAAFKALHEFGILVPAHKLHAGVLARTITGRLGRRLCAHKSGRRPRENSKGVDSREFSGILALLWRLSSPSW